MIGKMTSSKGMIIWLWWGNWRKTVVASKSMVCFYFMNCIQFVIFTTCLKSLLYRFVTRGCFKSLSSTLSQVIYWSYDKSVINSMYDKINFIKFFLNKWLFCPTIYHRLVYNGSEDSLYVHHDILLESFPLCLEWMSYDPGASGKSGMFTSIFVILNKNYHIPRFYYRRILLFASAVAVSLSRTIHIS